MALAVGLDGCPGGWIAAVVRDGRLLAVEYLESARAALEAYPDAEAFAFDIPIGLSRTGDREADRAARRYLPRGRAPSVFNAPPLAALHAASYEEANEASRQVAGKGLSRQSFALLTKIRELQEIAPEDARVHEAHPEVSFTALAGGRALPSKKTWDGLMQRRALLSAAGLAIPDLVGEPSGRGAADDIVDAVACAWTAARIARGEAQPLPDPPQRIEGREVAIWY